jgi:TRAP-type C4-dicarboxylate transport system permease small subunit
MKDLGSPARAASIASSEQTGQPAHGEATADALPGFSLAAVIDASLRFVLVAALLVELGVVFCSIFSRSLFGIPWTWTNEAAEMSLTSMAFLGGAFAYRRGEHAFIHTLLDALPAGWRRNCLALIQYFVLTVALTMGASAHSFFLARWHDLTWADW